jgi:hypothetical protein
MAELPAVAEKKVAGFPIALWGLGIGGAVLIGLYLRNRSSASAATDPAAAPTALVYTGTGGGDSTSTTATSTTPDSSTDTNEDWANRAKTYLLAKGYDASAVDAAINSYIAGVTPNAQQNALVSEAISGVGPTPQTLPPTQGDAPVTASQVPSWSSPVTQTWTPPTAQGTFYTVKDGDTLATIAKAAYNIVLPTQYGMIDQGAAAIYNANAFQIANPKTLTAGTKIYVPVIPNEEFFNQSSAVPLGYQSNTASEAKDWGMAAGVVPTTSAYFGTMSQLDKGNPTHHPPSPTGTGGKP